MADDDPRLIAAEAASSTAGGLLIAFGNLDSYHVCALFGLAVVYVIGLAIRLRLADRARRKLNSRLHDAGDADT